MCWILLAAIGAADESAITVRHNVETFTSTITIESTRGEVAWADILRGIARAKGFDDAALDGIFAEHRVDISGWPALLQVAAYNAVLSPRVRLDIQRNSEDEQDLTLVITLNRQALLSSQRSMKAWLRERILSVLSPKDRDSSHDPFGLALDDDWQDVETDRNLVVVIHGLNSSVRQTEPLLALVRDQGFPCGYFNYPNDQSIDESAHRLADELEKLSRQYPARQVTLLTHSMGGLVAREVIENASLDPGSVNQLIMIAPPNQGSLLAYFAFGLDVWEFVTSRIRREETKDMYAAIEDGFSEATVDLQPDSPFLRRLNSRPRNPNVRYTIFLGTGGPLTDAELQGMREAIDSLGERSRWVRFFGGKIDPWLADLDEVVSGKGDGAVAVKRGHLTGVSDVVVGEFSHTNILSAHPRGSVTEVHGEIVKRLLP